MDPNDRLEAALIGIEEHLKVSYPPLEGRRFEFNDAASSAYRDDAVDEGQLVDLREVASRGWCNNDTGRGSCWGR